MNCRTFQEKWLELTTGELAAAAAQAHEAHRRTCPVCGRFAAECDGVWKSLEASAPVETPRMLRASTLDRVGDLLREERLSVAGGLSLKQLFFSLLGGGALAFFGLWSLSRQAALEVIPVAAISACVIWWSGLFMLSCGLIAGPFRYGNLKLKMISSIGVAGVGVLFVGTFFCPQLQLMAYWLESVPGRFLTGLWGEGMSHVAFGFLYAMVPTLLVSLTFGRRISSERIRHGVLAALMFLLLLLPIIYIQCFYLSLTIALLITVGVILGSFAGTLGGLGVYRFKHGFV